MSHWARALHSERKASGCPLGQRRRTVSACSQSLTCAITFQNPLGLKRHMWMRPGQEGTHQRSARHGHPPRPPKGPGAFANVRASQYTKSTRTSTRMPEAPFSEILIPKGNGGHEETNVASMSRAYVPRAPPAGAGMMAPAGDSFCTSAHSVQPGQGEANEETPAIAIPPQPPEGGQGRSRTQKRQDPESERVRERE